MSAECVKSSNMESDAQPQGQLCSRNCICCYTYSAFTAISLWFTILDDFFVCVYVTVSNQNIEEVTFRLCGWCMLGVFLLLALTRLGHECQDLLSLCNGMYVCTNKNRLCNAMINKQNWFILSSEKV